MLKKYNAEVYVDYEDNGFGDANVTPLLAIMSTDGGKGFDVVLETWGEK